MDKNNTKGIIIGVLISIIIIGAICAILNATNVVSFSSKHNSKNMNDGNAVVDIKAFYGTYKWHKYYTNEEGIDIRLNVKLVLNEDGTATYDAGDGYSYEATKGTYKLVDGKFVYTREYYNYENQENGVFDEPNKTETFEIIDKNTLQNSFNHQTTELKKQEEITKEKIAGTYTWSKNYTNQYGNEIKLNVKLVLNTDGTATYNAGDGYSAEATKGTYNLLDDKIIYTRKYYNYENHENGVFEEPNKTETFEIIDKDTLQNVFNDQVTELRKSNTSNNQMLSALVGKYEYTYSFIQSDVSDDNDCKTINLDETLELNADETFTYGRGANCSGGESASGTYSISDNKIYLYNQECVEDGNCRKKIVLTFAKNNGIITIKDNESTAGWKANSNWGSVKLPDTILKKVN